MTEDLYLKQTEKAVGQIYPVIKNQLGEIADGRHRKKSNPHWREETRKLDPVQTVLVRLVANVARREGEKEHRKDWNEAASRLRKIEPGKKPWLVTSGKSISQRLSQLSHIPLDHILEFLDDDFKDPVKVAARDGVTPSESLGPSEVMRVPKALAPEIRALMDQVKSSGSEAPELKKEVIRNVKTRLRDHSRELRSTSKMPPILRGFVETGKLKLQATKLIESKVPPKFFEEEAKHIIENGLNIEQAEAYLISQGPIYRAHQIGEKLEKHNSSSQPTKSPSFFKLHESKIRGRIEQGFDLENPEVANLGTRTELFQEIRQALRKATAGDEVEISVTIWAAPKPVEAK